MSANEKIYRHIYSATRRIPPVVGEITVLDGIIAAPAADALIADALQRAWFTFQAEGVDIGLVFGVSAAAVSTAPLLSADTGDGRCVLVPAGTLQEFEINNDNRFMRWTARTATGFIRYFRSSPLEPLS